jgi:hypothetical protein
MFCILLAALAAAALVLIMRPIYHRAARWHQSRRIRHAIECLEAVQNSLLSLAERKESQR